MGWEALARQAFKQDGPDMQAARDAFEALGGDPAVLDRWLPILFEQFEALGTGINAALDDDLATLTNPLGALGSDPVANIQLIEDWLDGAGSDAVPAFRAAVGATTLGGGYGGNATNDELQLLLVFVATNLPT